MGAEATCGEGGAAAYTFKAGPAPAQRPPAARAAARAPRRPPPALRLRCCGPPAPAAFRWGGGATALSAGSDARLSPSPTAGEPLQRERQALAECGLAQQVSAEVAKWVRVNRRPRKRKRKDREEVFEKLLPDQLVLLLEHLLEQKTVTPRTLQSLERTYHLSEQDAEVRHRWCELIVKHKYTKAYRDVERFLQEDQAMGIYLYGELMLSEDPRQQHLAHRCFELSREQMDRSSAAVVAEMLF